MMKFLPKTSLALLMFACVVQAGTISGTVVDSGGSPVAGALVKLENGELVTTTGTDGRFTLSGTPRLSPPLANQILPRSLQAWVQNGLLTLHVGEKSPVTITTHTIQGRIVSTQRKILGTGSHSVAITPKATGIYLCKVESGGDSTVLKVAVMGKKVHGARPYGGIPRSALSRTAETIYDVIAVTKDGYLNYRSAVTNLDTSGIEIAMIVCEGTLSDMDGNEYQTVRIGNQVWMAENLRTTRLNDGTPITLDTSSYDWTWTGGAEYCFYQNTTDADSIQKYGALYNWYAVHTDLLAPTGWHVPTDEDWDTLYACLVANGYNYDGTTTGDKTAKSLAQKCDWSQSSNIGEIGYRLTENNQSGFAALPAGYRNIDGTFFSIGYNAYWWSATMFDEVYSGMRRLSYGSENFFRTERYAQTCGFSVRLVKDN